MRRLSGAALTVDRGSGFTESTTACVTPVNTGHQKRVSILRISKKEVTMEIHWWLILGVFIGALVGSLTAGYFWEWFNNRKRR